jgi:outer membrane protein TolC
MALMTAVCPRAVAAQPAPLRLSPEQAVTLALEHNLALKSARLGPQIADLDVNAAATAWTPELSTRLMNSTSEAPPLSALDQAQTTLRDRQLGSELTVAQQLPWGSSYRIGWTGGRRASNSLVMRYRPELTAGATATLVQPLLRGLTFDAARAQRETSRRRRDIAAAGLISATASTKHEVLYAYRSWIYSREFLDVQRESLGLAQTLLDGNRSRVAAGALAAVDIIEAEAEVARRAEAIAISEKNVANAEDLLRMLILEPAEARTAAPLEPDLPTEVPPPAVPADLVERALAGRQDLQAMRSSLDIDGINIRQSRNDALPDASLRIAYALRGTGGTELLRENGFANPVTGSLQRSFASVLDDLARTRYPTWSVELAVSYPLGTARAEANTARATLQRQQNEVALAASEQRVVTEVNAARREVLANEKRLDSTAVAVSLAERRLDAEQRKFVVGLSTSFFVFQAQRDLAEAREARLRSVLDHRLSLADLDVVQTIPIARPVEIDGL